MSLNTDNAILSNAIKVDSSYNVGIGGAADASFKLKVSGTTSLTGALSGTSATFSSNITASGSGNIVIQAISSNNFPLFQLVDSRVGGATWNIEGGRNIGNLQFRSNIFGNSVLELASTGAATFSSSVSGTSIRSSAVGSFGFNTANNGEFQIYATASDGMIMAGRGSSNDMVITNKNGSDVFRIPTGTTIANFVGNVGIGTSPTALLHLGVANAAVDGTKGVKITNPAGTTVMLECGVSSDSFVGTTSASDFSIRTSNSERMRITSGGNVGIGATSFSGRFSVHDAIYSEYFRVASGVIGGNTTSIYIAWNNAGNIDIRQVLVGAADSGGTGYRLLRIPNT